MPPVKEKEKKVSWLPIAAVGVGVAAVGFGLYFYTKKPPGVYPRDIIRAHFKFDYLGDGGDYVLLVRFGWRGVFGFDPEEGMDKYMLAVSLPEPDTYEFDIDCEIPMGAKPSTYDAEGSILTPEMVPGQDWIKRVFADKVIVVKEE